MMNRLSDRDINCLAWDRVHGFYPRVRDALCARQPDLDKRQAKRQAWKIVSDSFADVREIILRGGDDMPPAVAAVVNDDTWMI